MLQCMGNDDPPALYPNLTHVTQVTIDQNVLVRASSELTMPEASRIADNTLEYTVKTMLWALRAPEILKVAQGTFV